MRLILSLCLLLSLLACGNSGPTDAGERAITPADENPSSLLGAQPVLLDQACSASTPGELAPICEAIATASKSVVEQCSGMAESDFCATFGGNVYGLVAGCYAYGEEQFGSQARTFCKIADTLVSGVASYCRQIPGTAPELCALFSSDLIAESMIEAYQASSTHAAHVLQRELSANLPLRHTMYPATHNSFNATDANTPPSLSGSDANQRYRLVDQLRMDIRGIEIDVHWMPSLLDGGFRATVCHGNAFHAGCTYEKSLRDELSELRVWLDANPGEVIIVDLENNMDQPLDGVFSPDRYALASADIFDTIGDLLYLPDTDDPRACGQGQPLQASVRDVRARGKQVILYGACDYVHQGQSLMFDRTDTHLQKGGGSYIGISAPDNCIFSLDEIDQSWVRFYEDGTMVGALTGVERLATADEVQQMARCNINMPSVDHILPFDGRLQAFLWSWDVDEPASAADATSVVHKDNGHFAAVSSAASALACVHPQQAVIVDGALNPQRWQIALGTCPAPYVFGVPVHGLDNEALKLAKAAAGIDTVTLNWQRSQGGAWIAPN